MCIRRKTWGQIGKNRKSYNHFHTIFSAFFSVKTAEEAFIFEVDSRQKRDQWAVAIRDVVNFIQIPLPGARAAAGYRNPMQFERQMSNRSDDD